MRSRRANPVRISLPPPAGAPSLRASTEKTTLGVCWLGLALGLGLVESWSSDLLSSGWFSVSLLASFDFADALRISETF